MNIISKATAAVRVTNMKMTAYCSSALYLVWCLPIKSKTQTLRNSVIMSRRKLSFIISKTTVDVRVTI